MGLAKQSLPGRVDEPASLEWRLLEGSHQGWVDLSVTPIPCESGEGVGSGRASLALRSSQAGLSQDPTLSCHECLGR